MIEQIKIYGLASQTLIKAIKIPQPLPLELSLMSLLIQNGITIASSCNGVGSCHKCNVNGKLLSCQITVSDFIATNLNLEVKISYL